MDDHTWHAPEPVGTVPAARWGHCAVQLDGHTLLVYGGFVPGQGQGESGEHSKAAYLLDTDQLVWTRARFAGSQPPASVGGQLLKSGERVYLVCGFDGKGFSGAAFTIDFNAAGAVWTKAQFREGSAVPPAGDGFALAAPTQPPEPPPDPPEAVLWGGWDLVEYPSTVHLIRHRRGERPRSSSGYHSAASMRDRVYDVEFEPLQAAVDAEEDVLRRLPCMAVGGGDGDDSDADSSDSSDDEGDSDAKADEDADADADDEVVTARRGHSLTAVGASTMLIAFGGAVGYDRFMTGLAGLDVSAPDAPVWRRLRAAGREPAPRAWHSACGTQRAVVVFGGLGYGGALGDLWVLHVDPLAWSVPPVYGEPPRARAAHVAVLNGATMLVFGGHTGDPAEALGDVHVLTLADPLADTARALAPDLTVAQSLRTVRVNGQAQEVREQQRAQGRGVALSISGVAAAASASSVAAGSSAVAGSSAEDEVSELPQRRPMPRQSSSKMFLHMRKSGLSFGR